MEESKANTSLVLQVINNYGDVVKKLKNESVNLKSLDNFFKDFTKLNESYAKSLINLLSYLPSQSSNSSLQAAIYTLNKELKSFADQCLNTVKTLQKNIIPSLDQFRSFYDKQSTKLIKTGNGIINELTEARKETMASRNEYMKSAKDLDRMQTELQEIIKKVKEGNPMVNIMDPALTNKGTQMLDLKLNTDNGFKVYKKNVERTNELMKLKYSEYYNLLDNMLQLEEGRIEISKESINKNLEAMKSLEHLYIDKINSITNVAEYVNSRNDVNMFVASMSRAGLNTLFIPIDCVEYRPGIETTFKRLPKEKMVGDVQDILKNAIMTLINGNSLGLESKAAAIEQLHKPSGKEIFAENLVSCVGHPILVNEEAFNTFGELMTCILTAFVLEKDYNSFILNSILKASKGIHTKVKGKTRYLFSALAKHGIWQEMERWKVLIRNRIEERIEETKQVVIQRRSLQGLINEGLLKKLKNSFFSLGKIFTPVGEEDAGQDMQKAISSTVTQELGQFVFYFSNLCIKFTKAQEILRYFGNEYGLNPMKIYEMELSLKASQPFLVPEADSPKERVAQKELEHKLQKLNNSVILFHIKQSISFLSNGKDLINLLILNKRYYETLKIPIFKHILFETNIEITLPNRLNIWLQIIDYKDFNCDYGELKAKLIKDPSLLPKQIEDLITVDVARSIPHNKALSHSALTSILRAYAYYNKTIEYCQGMNFIAGFLYILFQDEEKVFKFFATLIDKYHMRDLFVHDVPLLKRYFYKIDRLFYLHCPEVSEYFRNENVNSSLFTSAWFITLFTYAIQDTTEPIPPLMLLRIWDAFLLDGWKSLFKVGVFIMKEFEPRILKAKFEETLMMLGGLPRSQLMQGTEGVKRMIKFLRETKVTKRILKCFDKEYHEELQSIKETISTISNK